MHKFKCDNKNLENCLNSLNNTELHFLMLEKNHLNLTDLDFSEYERYLALSNSKTLQFAAELKEKYQIIIDPHNIISFIDLNNFHEEIIEAIKLKLLAKSEVKSFILSSYDELSKDHTTQSDPTGNGIQLDSVINDLSSSKIPESIITNFIQLLNQAIFENDYPFLTLQEVVTGKTPPSKQKLIAIGRTLWISYNISALSLCKPFVDNYLSSVENYDNNIYPKYLDRREKYALEMMEELEIYFND